jgi:imidazolonepropionase-like amidohydrolase
MHVADRVGTVEIGKYGDLVILNTDPLSDIGSLRRRASIHRVVKGGVPLVPADVAPEVVRWSKDTDR